MHMYIYLYEYIWLLTNFNFKSPGFGFIINSNKENVKVSLFMWHRNWCGNGNVDTKPKHKSVTFKLTHWMKIFLRLFIILLIFSYGLTHKIKYKFSHTCLTSSIADGIKLNQLTKHRYICIFGHSNLINVRIDLGVTSENIWNILYSLKNNWNKINQP